MLGTGSKLLAATFGLALLWPSFHRNIQEEVTSPFERARALHQQVPLIDGHNDLPWQYRKRFQRAVSNLDIAQPQASLMTDIPRLVKGASEDSSGRYTCLRPSRAARLCGLPWNKSMWSIN